MKSCSIANHFTDVSSDTDDPPKNIRFIIVDQQNNTNNISPDDIDFEFERLSLYIKDITAQTIGIEIHVQNALSNDKTYDN